MQLNVSYRDHAVRCKHIIYLIIYHYNFFLLIHCQWWLMAMKDRTFHSNLNFTLHLLKVAVTVILNEQHHSMFPSP